MRNLNARIVVSVLTFVVALGGALVVLSMRDGDGDGASGTGSGSKDRGGAATSAIWAVGDHWTVKVRQDAGAITPDGDHSVALIPFQFDVTGAPKAAGDTWKVHVAQDGAEGPFAKGWRLEYSEKGGQMRLLRVAVGDEPPLEAELASIVLGPQFPYEVSYRAHPKNATIDAARLVKRAALPPTAQPGGGKDHTGATPPATAPPLPGAGAATPGAAPAAGRG
ncbi:MAG: hypothetical protein JWM98_513 [Thermoleophilia bacterium]|nr:hypothetical protein [Thermoleophilia bacterium]